MLLIIKSFFFTAQNFFINYFYILFWYFSLKTVENGLNKNDSPSSTQCYQGLQHLSNPAEVADLCFVFAPVHPDLFFYTLTCMVYLSGTAVTLYWKKSTLYKTLCSHWTWTTCPAKSRLLQNSMPQPHLLWILFLQPCPNYLWQNLCYRPVNDGNSNNNVHIQTKLQNGSLQNRDHIDHSSLKWVK